MRSVVHCETVSAVSEAARELDLGGHPIATPPADAEMQRAAVVLCDLASMAYYIGGIVETAIGKAAPWFILGVMVFSYAVRSVYIESCAMFVRGGVYRVVRTAMGGFMGKLAVAALIFDYILTGPISSVTAGQYLVSLLLETLESLHVAGSYVLSIQAPDIGFGQRVIGSQTGIENAAQIRIDPSAVLVPQRITQRVECGLLTRHERQRET